MLNDFISEIRPYYQQGLIESVDHAPEVGENAVILKSGDKLTVVNFVKNNAEISFGNNQAVVLSGFSLGHVARFVLQSLGRGDFRLPVNLVASFREKAYPSEFKNAVIGPVGIVAGDRLGLFNAVYKDTHGRFYIHQEEARLSLRLYKELYDRNSEAELLKLPRLFSSETPPVFTRAYNLVSEETAQEGLKSYKLTPIMECVEKGIALRPEMIDLPGTGVILSGDKRYSVSSIRESAVALSEAWESALAGKAVKAPAVAPFAVLSADLGQTVKASKRAQVNIVLSSNTFFGKVEEERSIVSSFDETLDLFAALERDGSTSKPDIILQAIKSTKIVEPEAPVMVKSAIKSSVFAELADMTGKANFLKSSDSPEPVQTQKFIKDHAIPDWLSQSATFSIISA